jgi:DNA helicase II / ATP-dependent DNA helicase PcrA
VKDSNIRLKLVELIWHLKKENMNLGDWLLHITNSLDFSSNLEEYKRIYPDDFEELEKLMRITRKDNILGKNKLSDFVNLADGVQLTTIHSSKGMEFDVVIIAGVENISDDENGKRLFYVGTTRAEREVCLVYSKGPYSNLKHINNLIHKCKRLNYFSHSKEGFTEKKPRQ